MLISLQANDRDHVKCSHCVHVFGQHRGYAITRIKRLRPYLDNVVLEFDNNTAERAMRPSALGRKNYLLMGSESGGQSAAIA